MGFSSRRTAFGVTLAVAALLVTRPLAAQQGTISGRVTEKASSRPLSGAQIAVVGTTLRTVTGADGRFQLANVTPGPASVRVSFIGYLSATQSTTVTAGGTAQLDFALAPSAVGLDAIVVTATGNQAVREQGTAPHNVDAAAVAKLAPITNMADLLSARTPGVTVLESGGTTGSGTRIRIRGSNSVSLSNDPVLVLDGIRIENNASSASVGVGGQVPSRLNDISPLDLERVQVASGPSASVLFGTDAANGVIQLETKHGQPGPTQWAFAMEGGTINDIGSYPANYTGLTSTGGTCTLTRVAEGTCTQASVRVFNPIEQRSPFQTGNRALFSASASGGSEKTTFYVAGHVNKEDGVYAINQNRQVNLLANVHDQVRPNLEFKITTMYTAGRLRLPDNDNDVFGVLSSGFLGGSDSTVNQGYGFLTPTQSFTIRSFQHIDHFTGALNTTYRPRDFLELHGVLGTDFTNRYDERTFSPGAIPASFNLAASQGNRSANPFGIYNWTGNFWATATFALTPNLSSTTSAGLQYYRARSHGVLSFVQGLASGCPSLACGVIPSANETTVESITLGRFFEERLALKNRLFVNGAVRSDDNSSFGKRFGNILYPKAQVSWVLSEEPFLNMPSWVTSLRLRAAYGSAGLHPGPLDALQFATATPVVVSSSDVPGITFGSLGNADLKPEHTDEAEVGFDLDLRPLATNLAFTFFNKVSHDALINVTLPPSCGCGNSIFKNLGSASNKGVEITAGATLVDRPNLLFDLNLSAWGTRSRVRTLGQGIQSIVFGLGGFSQRHQPGYAPGSYFMVPYTYSDLNHDGLIDTNEVKLGTAGPVFQGQPLPDHGGTAVATITIYHHWHFYGLLDGRFGNKLFNSTEQFRCGLNNCRGRNDPSASLADQAAAVANIKGTQAGYIQDGGFVKLREISLTYDAPPSWAARLGASTLSFTVAGRNLKTWTNYRGLDPEVNEAGQANFTTADFLTQPPVRYWIGRLNITF